MIFNIAEERINCEAATVLIIVTNQHTKSQ